VQELQPTQTIPTFLLALRLKAGELDCLLLYVPAQEEWQQPQLELPDRCDTSRRESLQSPSSQFPDSILYDIATWIAGTSC